MAWNTLENQDSVLSVLVVFVPFEEEIEAVGDDVVGIDYPKEFGPCRTGGFLVGVGDSLHTMDALGRWKSTSQQIPVLVGF